MDNDKLLFEMNWWDNTYQIISDFNLIEEKIILGEKKGHCRFCGRNSPEVSFHNEAHAIPESLGNDKIFSNYECDECNHEFGNTIEDHLNKYLMPFRIGSIILGKKNKLSYKIGENDRLDVSDRRWNITHIMAENESIDNENAKNIDMPDTLIEEIDEHTIRFKIIRQSYIPILVYKAFIKIALTLMPENELFLFKETFGWLKNHEKRIEDFFSQFLLMRFFPGYSPFPFMKAIILKRKNDDFEVPMFQTFLSFSNFTFQYIIPCFEKDKHLDGKTINFRSFLTPFDIGTYQYNTGSGLINLCNHEIIKNEMIPIDMHYEGKEFKMEM